MNDCKAQKDTRHIIEALSRFKERTGYTPSGIKAALIDMDGTLYDSMPWHARAWHRMITELGIEATVDEFFSYEGMTGKATVNLLFERAFGRTASDEEVTELYARKSLYFQQNNHAEVMPGAQSMVSTYRSRGITPILVTGSGQATLMARLTEDFFGEFPAERRITSRDVQHGKPSPEPYLKGLELAGVQPWEAVVVENAPLGVRSGVAAGIFTFAVKTGPVPMSSLIDAGADLCFDSMKEFANELPSILDNINSFNPCLL